MCRCAKRARGHDDARYVVTMKSTNAKQVVYAEFPGSLTKDIRAVDLSMRFVSP